MVKCVHSVHKMYISISFTWYKFLAWFFPSYELNRVAGKWTLHCKWITSHSFNWTNGSYIWRSCRKIKSIPVFGMYTLLWFTSHIRMFILNVKIWWVCDEEKAINKKRWTENRNYYTKCTSQTLWLVTYSDCQYFNCFNNILGILSMIYSALFVCIQSRFMNIVE